MVASFIISLFFLSPNITGNAISSFSTKTSNVFGFAFFLLSFMLFVFLASGSLEKRVENVGYIETKRGSIYEYLPGKKTQRFKKVEGRKYEPQDAIVFIPDWQTVQRTAPKELLAQGIFGENETQYEQIIFSYVQPDRMDKGALIVNEHGKALTTNDEIIKESGQILLAFQNKRNGKINFAIPVSRTPKLGYYPFDERTHQLRGNSLRDSHIGHKVVRIVYRNGRVVQ